MQNTVVISVVALCSNSLVQYVSSKDVVSLTPEAESGECLVNGSEAAPSIL